MGIEWSLKLKNRELNEALAVIQKYLIDAGFQDLAVDLKSITIPSQCQGWSDMEFIIDDGFVYCLCHLGALNGTRLMEQVQKNLEENGFELSLEEL